jgi:uncharacterized protein (TIGR00288 family)
MEVRNIAVFIDFENFARQEAFDAHQLIERLKERGRLIVKKAYADWGRFAKYKRQMMENSIELTEMPSHGQKGKNSADIKLVVDAIETAITKPYIDTFVVVSGDSDYTPLISKLREYNKYVIVVGEERSVSELLKGYCDELIYYSLLVNPPAAATVGGKPAKMDEAYALLRRAVATLDKDGSEARGSVVKRMMCQLDAGFAESNYGFGQFRRFLRAGEKDGVIALRQMESGGDVLVELRGE